MCRPTSEGGRRCPACSSSEGQARHNERRRRNRAIKKALIDRLEQVDPEAVDRVQQMTPGTAKDWARDFGHAEYLQEAGMTPGSVSWATTDADSQPEPSPAQGWWDDRSTTTEGGSALGSGVAVDRVADAAMGEQLARAGFGPVGSKVPLIDADDHASWGSSEGGGREGGEPWMSAVVLRQVDALEAWQGRSEVDRAMLAASVTGRQANEMAGLNGTYRVQLGDSMIGYHKPFAEVDVNASQRFGQLVAEQPIHEVAAWEFAAEMGSPWRGLVAPCVLRDVDGQLGSVSLERTGSLPPELRPEVRPDEVDARAAGFFDALTGQQDRHFGNLLLDREGHLSLIDHGFGFRRHGDPVNWSLLHAGREGTRVTQAERKLLHRLHDSEDLFGLARVLEPARAAAVRRRGEWMLERGEVCPVDDSQIQ